MSSCSIISDNNLDPYKVIYPNAIKSTHSVSGSLSPATDEKTGRWSKDEHSLFLNGLETYGRDWKKISQIVRITYIYKIPTRTVVQVRTHAQKYFHKIQSGV